MRVKRFKRMGFAVCALASLMAAAFVFVSCLPKDAAELVKEAEKVLGNAAELKITDVFTLNTFKISVDVQLLGKATLVWSGGDIRFTRKVEGKTVDVEFTAENVDMKVSPAALGAKVNAEAFKDVKIALRLRLKEDVLSFYLGVTGLNAVLSESDDKIEIKTELVKTDASTANVINLFARRPVLGSFAKDGEFNKSAMTYVYKLPTPEKVNNELTRVFKMFIDLNLDDLRGVIDALENIFGSSDIEKIANDHIAYKNGLTVTCAVKKSKNGYYFGEVSGRLSPTAKIEGETALRLAELLGLSGYLSGKPNIAINMDVGVMSTTEIGK